MSVGNVVCIIIIIIMIVRDSQGRRQLVAVVVLCGCFRKSYLVISNLCFLYG